MQHVLVDLMRNRCQDLYLRGGDNFVVVLRRGGAEAIPHERDGVGLGNDDLVFVKLIDVPRLESSGGTGMRVSSHMTNNLY